MTVALALSMSFCRSSRCRDEVEGPFGLGRRLRETCKNTKWIGYEVISTSLECTPMSHYLHVGAKSDWCGHVFRQYLEELVGGSRNRHLKHGLLLCGRTGDGRF
jgi:hypothetical protein